MKKLILFALLLLCPVMVWATASTQTQSHTLAASDVHKLTVDWTAGTDSTFTDYETLTTITGYVIQAITYTDSTGVGEYPADNYDIKVKNSDGVDIFGGALQNRDEKTPEIAYPLSGSLAATPFIDSKATIVIEGLDKASVKGTIIIYWRAR